MLGLLGLKSVQEEMAPGAGLCLLIESRRLNLVRGGVGGNFWIQPHERGSVRIGREEVFPAFRAPWTFSTGAAELILIVDETSRLELLVERRCSRA